DRDFARMLMNLSITPKVVVLCLVLAAGGEASAQAVNVVGGFPPGAAFANSMRTLSRHLRKHPPRHPRRIPPHIARAGGLPAANFLYNAAPRDGLTIGMFARGLAMQPLLDEQGIQYDARKFNWIGSLGTDVSMVLAWHNKPFKTLDDVRRREMIVAAT